MPIARSCDAWETLVTRASVRLNARVFPLPRSWSWILSVKGDIDSFIVRIWREAVDSAGDVVNWKGYIEHVDSENHLYFQDLGSIEEFIRRHSQLPSSGEEVPKPIRKWTRHG